MKRIVSLLFLLFSICSLSAQENISTAVEEKIHVFVQKKAYPPGTEIKLLKDSLMKEMKEMKESWQLSFAEVLLKIVIEKDGSVTNLKVISDEWKPTDVMEKKLLEMINSKGKWLPAKHNGLQVRSSYHIRMNFQI